MLGSLAVGTLGVAPRSSESQPRQGRQRVGADGGGRDAWGRGGFLRGGGGQAPRPAPRACRGHSRPPSSCCCVACFARRRLGFGVRSGAGLHGPGTTSRVSLRTRSGWSSVPLRPAPHRPRQRGGARRAQTAAWRPSVSLPGTASLQRGLAPAIEKGAPGAPSPTPTVPGGLGGRRGGGSAGTLQQVSVCWRVCVGVCVRRACARWASAAGGRARARVPGEGPPAVLQPRSQGGAGPTSQAEARLLRTSREGIPTRPPTRPPGQAPVPTSSATVPPSQLPA